MSDPTATEQQFNDWLRKIRRDLHQYPEIYFQEVRTSQYISDRLHELDIPHRTGIAGTGIVATLGSDAPGKPGIALRADMDALPLEEKTGLPFASKNPGVMHACGHDGHVAMLLGAAALLKQSPPDGRITLLFQPAEEREGGARHLVEAGVLAGVDAIFGGHVDRHFKVGEIAIEPGLICAFTDRFNIEIHGRGGHAAKPHETIDSIVVASLLVMSIQTLVSREINPSYPTVVTVGKITGGSAANVIAERASLEGTIRSTHEDIRQQIINGLKRMVTAMEDLYNARTALEIIPGYPPIINETAATTLAQEAARTIVGADGVVGLPTPSLGGEDFSYYLQQVPGCFVRFGGQKKGLENVPAHSPFFDFDEGVLPVGAHFFNAIARHAIDYFSRTKPNSRHCGEHQKTTMQ